MGGRSWLPPRQTLGAGGRVAGRAAIEEQAGMAAEDREVTDDPSIFLDFGENQTIPLHTFELHFVH